MKTPCEVSMWYVVPYIRRQLAISLVKDLKFKQSQAARKLDLTDAAISQYISKKRANIKIDDPSIDLEIKNSARTIAESEEKETVNEEICKLCKLINDVCEMGDLAGGCKKCP